MFEHHFGLRENPFVAGHHAKFVYPSPEHQEALAHLRYGIENREPFVLITGEVGTGKTTALYDALAEWQNRIVVALITNSALTRNELLEEIALRFGVAVNGLVSKPQILAHLEHALTAIYARGDRAILLLDEAQNLERDLLEEIRMLSNLELDGSKLVQVFLVGQPELEAKLSRPELRQMRQRITVHYRLRPLSAEDTEHYIHHRIGVAGGHAATIFPSDACREVHRLTHGIPREINTVCSQALLNAFVEDARSVGAKHVTAAANEIEFESVLEGEDVPESLRDQMTEAPRASAPAAETPAAPATTPAAASPAPVAATPPAPPAAPSGAPSGPPRLSIPDQTDPPEPSIASIEQELQEAEAQALAFEPDVEEEDEEEDLAFEPEVEEEDEEEDLEFEPEVEESVEEFEIAEVPGDEPPAETTEPASEAAIDLSMIDRWMAQQADTKARAADPEAGAPAPKPGPAKPVFGTTTVIPAAVVQSPAPAASPRRSLAEEQRAALPPRLRAKLDSADESGSEREHGSPSRWWFAAVGLVVLVMAGVLLVRFGPWRAHRGTSSTIGATALTPVPSITEPPTSSAAIPKSDSIARVAVSTATSALAPKSTAANPTANPKPVAKPPSPAPPKPVAARPKPTTSSVGTSATLKPATRATYGIAVATFLESGRAETERAKISASTHLPASVSEVMDGGANVYRIVLGGFDSRAAAENAASNLIKDGLIEEARVIQTGRGARP